MRKVFTETSSILYRSNGHWCGRSFAVSVQKDVSKVQKGRKRVSKAERKAMVGSFVNKYRATNAGKFPTISEAIKQVGGSFYVIKKVLQELECQSKISSTNTRNNIELRKVVLDVNETSKQVEEVKGTRLRSAPINKDVKTVAGYYLGIGDSSLKNVGTEEGPESSNSFLKTMSEEVVKHKRRDECSTYAGGQNHIFEGKAEGDIHQCPEKPEHGVKERSHSDGLLDLGRPKSRSEQSQQFSELDKCARALSKKHNDDRELSKKSSVWGNLKTLADGIIKMWKKR